MSFIRRLVSRIRRAMILALDPLRFRQELLKRSSSASLEDKVAYDVFPRPNYAYAVYKAAEQAKALNLPRISVIEFGCAGGRGLLALEAIANEVSAELDVQIDIFGFDIGEGLPRPTDHRDLPYAWKSGLFKMDVEKLEARLTSAKLILGDVAKTVEPFLARDDVAPVGFVSFDLDYYSSTVAALRIFEGDSSQMLPRVYCYFDDCIGPDNELHCEYVGELLAIKEFNERDDMMKLAPIHGLAHKRIFPAAWNDVTYVMHAFSHPLYGQYIPPRVDVQLSLPDQE